MSQGIRQQRQEGSIFQLGGAIDAIKIAAKGDHLGTAHLFVVSRMLRNERRRAAASNPGRKRTL